MKLYRITFKDGDFNHSTTFTATSREEAIKQFHSWADGLKVDLTFVACVEVK